MLYEFEFLQTYNFTIQHKMGVQNGMVNTLSRKHALLPSMEVKVVGSLRVVLERGE